MEKNESSVTLNLSERNELVFSMKVVGTTTKPSDVRLVLEDAECSYVIRGNSNDGESYKFDIPAMDKLGLKEGMTSAFIETIIDERRFKPMMLSVKFVRPVEVKAEAVIARSNVQTVPSVSEATVKVTMSEKKPKLEPMPLNEDNVLKLNEEQLRSFIRNSLKK